MEMKKRLDRLETQIKGKPLFVVQEDGRTVEVPGKAVLDVLCGMIEGVIGMRDEEEIPLFDVFLNARPDQDAPINLLRNMAHNTRNFPAGIAGEIPEDWPARRERYREEHSEHFPERD